MKVNTTNKYLIGLMGPTRGGKSSHVEGLVANNSNVGKIAFADQLKEEAYRRGWDGSKDPESRAKYLQDLSEELKKEHGESVFLDVGIMKALASDKQVIVFEDTRLLIEISGILREREGIIPCVLQIYDAQAEEAWLDAVLATGKHNNWAKHRSETEWRSVRHVFPGYANNREAGIQESVRGFQGFLETLISHIEVLNV